MAENSHIGWTTHTFNPWFGCQKVGPGCDHCYAEADFDLRRGIVRWGPGEPRKRSADSTWRQPLRWNRAAVRDGIRPRVFSASLADVFDNAVDPAWRSDLFTLIDATPALDWLLLTKRIGNVPAMTADRSQTLARVWLGATIVTQAEADRDLPKLTGIDAAVRFLSVEPMLEPLALDLTGIGWVIAGGESGPGARPADADWFRSLRNQCAAAGVPFFMKQMGGYPRKRADLDELPRDLRIREFPRAMGESDAE